MKIYGQLEKAQLENLAADIAAATAGRVYFQTVSGKPMLDDGALVRAMLRNDAKLIIGNSGTAADNIRAHRGAAGVLQFVSGADVTAEGTLSTVLNQISVRQENYTNAARPAFGNPGRVIFNTDVSSLQMDTGAAWMTIPTSTAAANILSTDLSTGSVTVNAGTTLTHPNLTIDVGHTYTINGSYFGGISLTVNGTLVVNGTAEIA